MKFSALLGVPPPPDTHTHAKKERQQQEKEELHNMLPIQDMNPIKKGKLRAALGLFYLVTLIFSSESEAVAAKPSRPPL